MFREQIRPHRSLPDPQAGAGIVLSLAFLSPPGEGNLPLTSLTSLTNQCFQGVSRFQAMTMQRFVALGKSL